VKWLTLLLWATGLAMLAAGLYLIVHKHSSSTTAQTTSTTSTVKKPLPTPHIVPTVLVYRVGPDKKLEVHANPVASGPIDAATALNALHVRAQITVSNGTATLSQLTAPDAASTAEIVWTLTQFPTIQRVSLPGHPGLTRQDEAAFAPPILVESPIGAAPVPHTFHVKGSAIVFEATLVVKLSAHGQPPIQRTLTATEGAPGLGTFDTTFHVAADGPATLTLYSPSAENGAPQHEVTLHLLIAD